MFHLHRREALRIGVAGALGSLATGAFADQDPKVLDELLNKAKKQPTQDRISSALSFVNTLALADAKLPANLKPRELHLRADKQQAFVNDGSMESFVAGMDDTLKADVLNATLLAQLAANKKFDRFGDSANWYKFYKDVLENVGWVIQNWDFTQFTSSGGSFTVATDVITYLPQVAEGISGGFPLRPPACPHRAPTVSAQLLGGAAGEGRARKARQVH